MTEDVFDGYGIPITLNKPDDFLKVRETLTRIGIASKKEQILFQSCHILHKKGFYAILHFKELFKIDGKESDITDEDLERRNVIAGLLKEWSLVTIIDESKMLNRAPMSQIKIVSFKEKSDWQLVPKYSIGNKRKVNE